MHASSSVVPDTSNVAAQTAVDRGRVVEYACTRREEPRTGRDGSMVLELSSSYAFHMGGRPVHEAICIEDCSEEDLEFRLIEGAQAAIAAGACVPDYVRAWMVAADNISKLQIRNTLKSIIIGIGKRRWIVAPSDADVAADQKLGGPTSTPSEAQQSHYHVSGFGTGGNTLEGRVTRLDVDGCDVTGVGDMRGRYQPVDCDFHRYIYENDPYFREHRRIRVLNNEDMESLRLRNELLDREEKQRLRDVVAKSRAIRKKQKNGEVLSRDEETFMHSPYAVADHPQETLYIRKRFVDMQDKAVTEKLREAYPWLKTMIPFVSGNHVMEMCLSEINNQGLPVKKFEVRPERCPFPASGRNTRRGGSSLDAQRQLVVDEPPPATYTLGFTAANIRGMLDFRGMTIHFSSRCSRLPHPEPIMIHASVYPHVNWCGDCRNLPGYFYQVRATAFEQRNSYNDDTASIVAQAESISSVDSS